MNERLSIGANVHYQHNFNGDQDGFSAIDLGAKYRMTRAGDTNSNIISDMSRELDDWFAKYVNPDYDGKNEAVTGGGQYGRHSFGGKV